MKPIDHGPKCIACTDPEQARGLIAAERAGLDAKAARATEHRAAGEAARQVYQTPGITEAAFGDALIRMLRELGAANVIAQEVLMHSAHLDRVEAAHPALTSTGGAA